MICFTLHSVFLFLTFCTPLIVCNSDSAIPSYDNDQIYLTEDTSLKPSEDIYKTLPAPHKTGWPLQEGYTGSIISNLNEYLSLFSDCLVNIQNFQGIDLLEWNYPIFLTRFDIVAALFFENSYPTTLQMKYGTVPNLEILHLNKTPWIRIPDIKPSDTIKLRWSCFAKLDVFYPEKADFPFYYEHYTQVNRELNVLGPSHTYFLSFTDNPYPRVFGDNTRPTYFILILHQNSTKLAKQFWIFNNKRSLDNLHTSQMFLLITDNLQRHSDNLLRIHSFSYLCFSCCNCKVVTVPLRKTAWKDQVQKLVTLTGKVPWKIIGLEPLKLFLSDEELSFRNFAFASDSIKRYLPDKAMAEYVMPNSTFRDWSRYESINSSVSLPSSCLEFNQFLVEDTFEFFYDPKQICYGPDLSLESKGVPALLKTRDSYTFVSCGATPWQKTSIYGFFSSFDLATWICIVTFVLIWPVLLSLIESDFKYRQVLLDSQTWLVGFTLLLEQGHCLVENRHGKGPLYYTCGLTLLVLIILSNAYKGKNIEHLSESFKVIPFTSIVDILKDNYTIYTKLTYAWNLESMEQTLGSDWISEYPEVRSEYGWQAPRAVLKQLEQKVLMPELYYESIYLNYESNLTSVEMVGKCNQVALLGWHSEIEKVSKEVQSRQNGSVEKSVFLGTKPLFVSQDGWGIAFWSDPDVSKRLAYLKQSGIPNEWMSIAKSKPDVSASIPVSLSLNGNVSVQFFTLLFGLSIAAITSIIEFVLFKLIVLLKLCQLIWKVLFKTLNKNKAKFHKTLMYAREGFYQTSIRTRPF